ncbi:MAG: NADH-quinone oxidoreductase subunit NuoF [bacterium]|nr:NADH-quinone oxidoreductase subunit NuoF [bacterium]
MNVIEPVLLRNIELENLFTFPVYQRTGGELAFQKALKEYKPDEIIELVKKSGLRGRGGAGFPTGLKWSFVPKETNKPKYLVCNADEGEPGTFKDRVILENNPHLLIEGILIAAYAIGAHKAYIYIRGEYLLGAMRLEQAIQESYAQGYLGPNILGSGYDLDIYVYRGAGSYECGEETALLESLEGKRGEPRLKPPFPALVGLYGCPTVINNVETLSCVPHIILNGADWFAHIGTEKNTGTKLFAISGHVNKPGVYELPMGIPLRALIYDYAGGIRNNRKLKAVLPGGASTPVLTEADLDCCLDFDSVLRAGSMLGSAAVIVMDETTCMVWVALRLTKFFAHESCGKCTPCRDGLSWLVQILETVEAGKGRKEDIDMILDICDNINGKSLCPLADGAIAPIISSIKKFRTEFEYHIENEAPCSKLRGIFSVR